MGVVRSHQSRSATRTTPAAVARYKVEPYVVAADVYSVPPHTGRGGWTWYTGSAGWMYRLITETFLGLRLEVDKLSFHPRVPADWKSSRFITAIAKRIITFPCSRSRRFLPADNESSSMAPNSRMRLCD